MLLNGAKVTESIAVGHAAMESASLNLTPKFTQVLKPLDRRDGIVRGARNSVTLYGILRDRIRKAFL